MFDKKMKNVADAVANILEERTTAHLNAKIVKDEAGRKIGEVYKNKLGWGAHHYATGHGEEMIDSEEEAHKLLKDLHDEHKSVRKEEIDPKKRTKDTLKGADEPTKQKDDVGPGSDGKSTKVKFRPGPLTTEGFKDKLFDRLYNHLDEASEELLARYMKSRGYNPTTTPKDKKIAITKSNEFKKWVADHQFEEAGYEDYSEEQLDEMINEVLGKDASAGEWISDFVHSDDPKFAGKSKKKRQQMALAAYYAKQRNEEAELDLDEAQPFFQEELEQFMQSEEFSELDEDSQNELKSYLFDENTEPKTNKEKKLASLAHPKDKITFKDVLVGRGVLKKEDVEVVSEGDVNPDDDDKFEKRLAKDRKENPEKYKWSDQKRDFRKKIDQENKQGVAEGKQPESDTVPFVEPYQKSQPDVQDKGTGGVHTPMSRAKHLARMALKKVKNEMLGKAGMTSEEAEQIDEISGELASRYLQKKHDRDYEKTGPNSYSLKEPTTIDKAAKSGASTIRALKIIQKKKAK